MERVAGILEQDSNPRLGVVLSACRGVTDALLNLIAAAERQEDSVAQSLEDIHVRHQGLAAALLSEGEARSGYLSTLARDCADIAGILQTVRLIRSASQTVRDLIAGYGELWSTRLFAAYLNQRGRRPGKVLWVDAREIVTVEWGPLGPVVLWEQSQAAAEKLAAEEAATLIITGFIARDASGLQSTLGRNGSDFSGSIFGALLDAAEIHIWTDVDGVLSADPRLVPEAKVIDSLSYNEAMELAYFGAKVIHPQTMAPAVRKGIPIYIRNSFAPEKPGTLICEKPQSSLAVKGITTIDRVALVNLEGAGMIGVPGTAHRLFGALRDHGISVILISQGSSEHSICFAIPEAEAVRAERVVRQAFEHELRGGQIQRVEVEPGCSILAVVGDGMAGAHGVAAKVFGALGSAAVNVRAIAQGASERNISTVIGRSAAARALRAVHSSFYLSAHTVSIGLIGPGLVGAALLDQLAAQAPRLRQLKLDLRVRGLMNSQRMYLADEAAPLERWREVLAAETREADLAEFARHVHAEHLPHAIIVDCTASAHVVASYPEWLADGIHIVTPNKRANSGDQAFYRRLQEAAHAGGAHYLYEATVGAGLPIIQTLRDLRHTGDEIRRIDGMLSGTLAYLFNMWDGSEPFSAVVRAARAKGYTEPDPRDDLSGMDFARKMIILGREMGLDLELSDVQLESLTPPALASCSLEEFLDRLPEFDQPMAQRLQAAQRRNRVLRYVGSLDPVSGSAVVGLRELELSDTFATIDLTDNVVRFHTQRYDRNPLIVQGPGAGPEVTAGGVFADILRVCAYLGAKL
jgi:aspartokinase/homoserine dehydrogenase 1